MTLDHSAVAGAAEVITVRSPATGQVVGSVPDMTGAAVAEACADLRRAQPSWEALGPRGRSAHLLRWLDWLLDNERRLLTLVQQETGSGSARVRPPRLVLEGVERETALATIRHALAHRP